MATLTATRAALDPGDLSLQKRRTPMGDAWRTLRRNPMAMAGLAIMAGWIVLLLLAPVLPIADPNQQALQDRLQAPSGVHYFGTDELGRDIFSRVIWGARMSIPAGIMVVLLAGTVGCFSGAVAGYFGGKLDTLIMRMADALLSFPSIILALAIAAIVGEPSLRNALIAVAIVLTPEYARVMRGQVLAIKSGEFVIAAESIGASKMRVMLRHIMPSTDAPIVVKSTLDVGSAIVLTAGLSFLGLGAVPPASEWGAMVKQGADKGLEYWWYAAAPGLAIMSVVMALNFVGDGLRDALDPKRRGR